MWDLTHPILSLPVLPDFPVYNIYLKRNMIEKGLLMFELIYLRYLIIGLIFITIRGEIIRPYSKILISI